MPLPKTATIRVPFDSGWETFNRNELETAVLLHLEHNGDRMTVRRLLVEQHEISPNAATYLTVAARICVEQGIEP